MWWLNLPVVAESPIVVAESANVVTESPIVLAEFAIVVAESANVVAESAIVQFRPRQQQPVLGDCTTTMEILVPVRSVRTVPWRIILVRFVTVRFHSVRFLRLGY